MHSMARDLQPVIRRVLALLEMYSLDAEFLLLRTAAVESRFQHIVQGYNSPGPALGLWQMEPDTAKDIIKNYLHYRQEIRIQMNGIVGFSEWGRDVEWHLKTKIDLQVAFARLQYRRDPHPIPAKDDLEGQADYWKRVYNTNLGAGDPADFVRIAREYGLQ